MASSRNSGLRAESNHTRSVQQFLREHGLTHLRVRHRAALITIESGPTDDPVRHTRLRRIGVHCWQLEMATHSGRWQPTPMQASLDELLELLLTRFGWTLASRV